MDNAALLNRRVIVLPLKPVDGSTIRPRQRTIIVTGADRLGTSMVARTLQTAGLFMDEVIFETVHQLAAGDKETLQSLIRTRNTQHEVWGVEVPNLQSMFLLRDLQLLRAPHLIAIFRDPVADVVQKPLEEVDGAKALTEAGTAQASLLEYCVRANCPTLMLSHEALSKPEEFAETLLQFCGIECDPAKLDANE